MRTIFARVTLMLVPLFLLLGCNNAAQNPNPQKPPPSETTAPPSNLSYSLNPAIYVVGTTISDNAPTSAGGPVDSYSINPALPSGLGFDAATGVISGTPTAPTNIQIFTVTAINSGGSTSADLVIEVTPALSLPPANLAYFSNPATYTVGMTITPNFPTSSGGVLSSYSVSPSLPAGIALDPATGIISGTPLSAASQQTYTVTAMNSAGSTSVGVVITVNSNTGIPPAPSNLTYTSNPATYTLNIAIANNTPSSSGGPVSSYSVSPALPLGLSLNSTTGLISGTPLAASNMQTYTVTAKNAGGSTSVRLVITVNMTLLPPANLVYSSNPATYSVGVAIVQNTPSFSGGAPTAYGVNPALPPGLTLDPKTGIISGTPTAASTTQFYGIVALNSAGSTIALLSITVNGSSVQPPTNLTYSINPATYTVNVAIANNTPSSSGGAVSSYSVSPALPNGLTLNTSSGIISGTPTAASTQQTYTVTATNSAGSTSVGLSITVNAQQTGQIGFVRNSDGAFFTSAQMVDSTTGAGWNLSVSTDANGTHAVITNANATAASLYILELQDNSGNKYTGISRTSSQAEYYTQGITASVEVTNSAANSTIVAYIAPLTTNVTNTGVGTLVSLAMPATITTTVAGSYLGCPATGKIVVNANPTISVTAAVPLIIGATNVDVGPATGTVSGPAGATFDSFGNVNMIASLAGALNICVGCTTDPAVMAAISKAINCPGL